MYMATPRGVTNICTILVPYTCYVLRVLYFSAFHFMYEVKYFALCKFDRSGESVWMQCSLYNMQCIPTPNTALHTIHNSGQIKHTSYSISGYLVVVKLAGVVVVKSHH